MDTTYRAMWRHGEATRRCAENTACDSGGHALLRLGLALVLIGGSVGLLDVAASQTQHDKGIVTTQTREGD